VSRHQVFYFFLQGKAPKEIHTILTETLACFLPGRAKDLSPPLYTTAEPRNHTQDPYNWSVAKLLEQETL